MWLSSILIGNLVLLASSSRCPEPKKPHRTSCTIFYNCVNLPGGGYVWVPSKCTEGLVFQPYLRVCVVPGDIWTCDTLSTESSLVTKRYQGAAESIDPTESSYLGYTRDSADFSETIDSSYVIEDDTSDLTTEAETPYPLIEFGETTMTTSHGDEGVKNVSYHKEEKYSYEYVNDRGRTPSTSTQRYKDIVNEHYKLLHELMSRLHVYKELSAAVSSAKNATTEAVLATHDRRQNVSLNYLVQRCVLAVSEAHRPEVTGNNLEMLIDGLDAENNVIRITDDLGNERYLTVGSYKAVARRLKPRSVSVLACTRNVRLPNRTDCGKYYMCEPKTAAIVGYSCPVNTAFNVNSRICDTESARTCKDDGRAAGEAAILVEQKRTDEEEREDEAHDEDSTEEEEEEEEEEPCREVGKMKDPASDFHYYICYSPAGSEEIKSVRMRCPNALIFCRSKRVCTTRRLCIASR
ncbi:PREDICTED: uncharacterized protein LOC106746613 [Dinoponera quadriceps]|uniref:Uncharacterized protein LOC106746613 n=1 Tax=Dinoponera quadriceps TaxID=609295 RepID=A0A6P3XKD8_DINQU|nr:PREDICTED: uncharacterized protein LOC106746613 [Dinoponera quadriceps]